MIDKSTQHHWNAKVGEFECKIVSIPKTETFTDYAFYKKSKKDNQWIEVDFEDTGILVYEIMAELMKRLID